MKRKKHALEGHDIDIRFTNTSLPMVTCHLRIHASCNFTVKYGHAANHPPTQCTRMGTLKQFGDNELSAG